jgi:glycosyltransferase involved in cell wall biosynthesis
MELGIPAERIEFGYNVVDNCFFGKIRNGECREQGGEAGLTTEDTTERLGGREMEQPKVGPKGEGVGTTESKSTELEAGARLSCQAGDAFSISFTSELARDSETPSCTRFANAPASSHATSDSLPSTELQVPAGPYFLASNRFVERKNLKGLIRAYARYVESFQGGKKVWPLLLLGDGELRAELETLCGELGLRTAGELSHGGAEHAEGEHLKPNYYKLKTPNTGGLVVFAGFRQIEELPTFYAGAGAFVHPAFEEPWGLVINEAMASGLPVLSSRNVGAAEELVVDGKTGYLFDPRNIEEMANAMSKVAGMTQEERLTMGRAAFEMVERKAPVKAFGEGLAKLLVGKL